MFSKSWTKCVKNGVCFGAILKVPSSAKTGALFDFYNILFKCQGVLSLLGNLTCVLNIEKLIFLNCGISKLGYLHLPEVKFPRRIAYETLKRSNSAPQIFWVLPYFSWPACREIEAIDLVLVSKKRAMCFF